MDYVYINAKKKVNIFVKKEVLIKDVAEITGIEKIVKKIENISILHIKESEKKSKNYLLSIIEIIEAIKKVNPEILVQNIGETYVIVSYFKEKKDTPKIVIFSKVFFVCCILLAGGAIAIMTFQTDAALPSAFEQLYIIFLGDTKLQPYLIEIPYAIGIAVGIIVFFNHFSKKRLTDDPTPIEVELRSYEVQVEDSIIEELLNEKESNK